MLLTVMTKMMTNAMIPSLDPALLQVCVTRGVEVRASPIYMPEHDAGRKYGLRCKVDEASKFWFWGFRVTGPRTWSHQKRLYFKPSIVSNNPCNGRPPSLGFVPCGVAVPEKFVREAIKT